MSNDTIEFEPTEIIMPPTPEPLPHIPVLTSVSCCLVLAVLYVGSLYIWRNKHSRDHPITIKQRFASVSIVMFIAPLFVYFFSSPELLSREPFPKLLGLRWNGLWQAIVIPYVLTMLFFLGPIYVNMLNGSMRGYLSADYWNGYFNDIIWVRNLIMAPISEEFVFRGCMMPLILQSFQPMVAVFITPLFFGVAHMHHITERLSQGVDLTTALLIGLFQFMYTTLFGFYCAFLFARTGHIIASVLVHGFCNHMGLPDFEDIWQQNSWQRVIAIAMYIVGFAGWVYLMPIVTAPSWYGNQLYWNV